VQIASNDDSIYRDVILENKAFYLDWVLPRVRAYMGHRGWEQPVIACLGGLGHPPPAEAEAEAGRSEIDAVSSVGDGRRSQSGISPQEVGTLQIYIQILQIHYSITVWTLILNSLCSHIHNIILV
jgi:hypothetical protein